MRGPVSLHSRLCFIRRLLTFIHCSVFTHTALLYIASRLRLFATFHLVKCTAQAQVHHLRLSLDTHMVSLRSARLHHVFIEMSDIIARRSLISACEGLLCMCSARDRRFLGVVYMHGMTD